MTEKTLTLRILTAEGTVFEGPVSAVFLPGSAGAFEVLPGHAPIVSTLDAGKLRWRTGDTESGQSVSGGAIILENNELTVCAQL